MCFKLIQYVDPTPGSDIKEVIKKTLYYSGHHNCVVRFRFNGVDMEVFLWKNESIDVQVGRYYKWFCEDLKRDKK